MIPADVPCPKCSQTVSPPTPVEGVSVIKSLNPCAGCGAHLNFAYVDGKCTHAEERTGEPEV